MSDKSSVKKISNSSLSKQLKISEDKAKEYDSFAKALISSIGVGIIVVDEYGIITEVNQITLELLGYKRTELIGEWLPRAVPVKDRDGNELPATEMPVLQSLISGQPSTAVMTYVKKDGTFFPVSGTSAPFMRDGSPRGAIITFRDFSHEMQVEQAKDEFVSLASHQLRTPITSILLYIELAKYEQENLSTELKNCLAKIEISAGNMQQLISDFLEISKLDLGRLEVNPIPVNLEELIDNQLSELYAYSSNNRVKVDFIKPPVNTVAITDPKLLTQAVHNLLTNAIRYKNQKNPEITILITCEEESFIIAVKDNGIGIPENAKLKIFQRLFRADNAVVAEGDGTGLGLYLVRKVVEVLDGKVWFESQENKGTTFFIQIPRHIA